MNYAQQCWIQGSSAVAFGAMLCVVPEGLLGWVLGPVQTHTVWMAQLCGAMLIALGMSLWGAADHEKPRSQRSICVANGVVDGCVAIWFASLVASGQAGFWVALLALMFTANAVTWGVAFPRSGD